RSSLSSITRMSATPVAGRNGATPRSLAPQRPGELAPRPRAGYDCRVETPQTHYAKSGDVHVAYQIVGDALHDHVYIPNGPHHVELNWENPPIARFLERLADLARLIAFDKRGTGMSDRVAGVPTLEARMDDVRAVMDAAGSDSAVLFAVGDAGPLAAL